MTHKELRIRRREGILRVHNLELKFKKYRARFWYYFLTPGGSIYDRCLVQIPLEDIQILEFFKTFQSQKERAILWRNHDFTNTFLADG